MLPPDVEEYNQLIIEKMFRKLRDEETVRININSSWLESIPISTLGLPDEFKNAPKVVNCLNYPYSDNPRRNNFHFNNIDMFEFVQICNQNNNGSDS